MSGAGYRMRIDTVLSFGNTALVVSCPSSTGEFATRMPPRTAQTASCGGRRYAPRGTQLCALQLAV